MSKVKELIYRPEEKKDFRKVEELTRLAFWDVYKPGCDEHVIVHKLRNVPAHVQALDLVAVDKEQIVGHIIYSRSRVVSDKDETFEVLSFGPISVHPNYQGMGIGAELINRTLLKARELGFKGVVIYGNPKYYHRFGFENAERFTIRTSNGENFDAFMALELVENGLAGISGRYFEDDVFHVEKEELERFDQSFQ